MSERTVKQQVRHKRIRKKVAGTGVRPRLSIHFSGRHITAQVIDDEIGKTLVSVHTTEETFRAENKSAGANANSAGKVGRMVAERGTAKNIRKVVFDRGGFKYHGKVKALADAAREAGFEF